MLKFASRLLLILALSTVGVSALESAPAPTPSNSVDETIEVHYADLNEVRRLVHCILPYLAFEISESPGAVTVHGTQQQVDIAREAVHVMDYQRPRP